MHKRYNCNLAQMASGDTDYIVISGKESKMAGFGFSEEEELLQQQVRDFA